MSQPDIKFGSAAMFGGHDFSSPSGFGSGEGAGIARVTFVLYDDSDLAKFNELGGWKALGTIKCIPYINTANNQTEIIARPINNHYNRWPLVNELVHIKRGVSSKSQGGTLNYDPEWYYTDIVPTWNATEHNATPDSNKLLKDSLHKSTYQEASNGISSNSNSKSDLSVTGVFNQTGKVNKLIKQPGDLTIEGRSSNSIKIGSTIDGFNSPITGPDRSPLIMLVNGHRDTNSKNPIFEDVNKDGSSFYMLNGHNVSFDPASFNFDSFYTKVSTAVKSNYVETLPIPNTPVSQSAATTDNSTKTTDTKPTSSTVLNATKTNDVVNTEDDLTKIPDKESSLPFVQETEDIIDLELSNNPVITNDTSPSISVKDIGVPFEVQINNYYCFVASVSMLLRSMGVPTSQNDLSRFVNTEHQLNLYKVANSFNKKLDRISLTGPYGGYDTIVSKFKATNKPFILEKKSLSTPGDLSRSHFVVVTGISSEGKIIANDPGRSNGKNKIIEKTDLKPTGGTLRIFN